MKTKPLLRKGTMWTVHISKINKIMNPNTYEYPDFLSARRFARSMTKEHRIVTTVYNQYGRRVASYGPQTQGGKITRPK